MYNKWISKKLFFSLDNVLHFFIPTIRHMYIYSRTVVRIISCFVSDRIGSVVCEERNTQGHRRGRTYLWILGNSVMPCAIELWLLHWLYFYENCDPSVNCDPTVNCDPSVCAYCPIKLHCPVISVDIQSAKIMWNLVIFNCVLCYICNLLNL